jgi:hypothetical protein
MMATATSHEQKIALAHLTRESGMHREKTINSLFRVFGRRLETA